MVITQTVKGMTNMNRKLTSYIDDLIRNNFTFGVDGYELDVESLGEPDIDDFMLQLHSLDDNDSRPYEFMDDDSSITSALRKLILDDSIDERIHFGEVIKDSMRNHYMPKMQEMINDRIDIVEHEDNEERGLSVGRHRDNGEIYYY